MRRFYWFSQSIINWFWRVLFLLTLYFAVTSPNIILGDNATFGTSTTMVTTGLVIGIILLIVMIYTYPSVRALLYNVFVTHQVLVGSCLLAVVVLAQIAFVTLVHPVSGFDAGMLHYAATNAKHAQELEVRSYYSLYPNNVAITLLMHWVSTVTGRTSWLFFDYITLALVDLSAVFNLISTRIVKPDALGTALYLHVGWLAVFPTIIVAYTDAWVLPLVSGFLLCYFIMRQITMSVAVRLLAAVMFGFSVILTYFTKPSAIIPVIAMVIIGLLSWLVKYKNISGRQVGMVLTMIVLIGGSMAIGYRIISTQVTKQTYIKIDQSRAIPPIHFMSMGVYGEGGYSAKQTLEMAGLPTKQEKSQYSIRMLKQRLKKLGVYGYLKFLLKKQRNNTADGTFGWLKEGHFFRDDQKPTNHGIRNKIKNYIYLYGRHIADFRFVAQLWWIILLIIIAIGFGPYSDGIQTLRLSMIGGFIFLLLFEGGRSRYLIQYLPCLLLLATFLSKQAVKNVGKVHAWYTKDVDLN